MSENFCRSCGGATPYPVNFGICSFCSHLRDQFAMAAMIGIAASPTRERSFNTISDLNDAADTAYSWADAMLEARKKGA